MPAHRAAGRGPGPGCGQGRKVALAGDQKAVYQKDNIGHFGLGSTCYTHFTSPIRRYPDLILHRLLKDYATKECNERGSLEFNYIESEDDYDVWQIV